MSKLLSPGQGRLAIQICAASAVAALLSGCSSDVTRFNDPFGNPFTTGSIAKPKHVASAKPVGTGRTPPVVAQALPPHPTTVARAVPPQTETPAVSHETTGSIAAPAGASVGGWSATGGTAVVVAQGETVDILSKRYGVLPHVLLHVNGMKTAADVQPGTRILVPIYNAVASVPGAQAAEQVASAPVARPVAAAPAKQAAAGSKREPVAKVAAVATRVAKVESAQVKAAAEPTRVAAAPVRAAKGAAQIKTAAIEPAPKAKASGKIAAAAPAPQPAAPVAPAKGVDPTPTASVPAQSATVANANGGPEFRWPARGRIIQGFKGGAGGNDGINIAVPEGTAVKAVEGGVVAYAGNELKGYGNLVLIRHPNGFVSAYANNGEIDVKRGDTVKRGQTIAKSGQSGNVASPQLHFELRKGSQPVDPTAYLAGL